MTCCGVFQNGSSHFNTILAQKKHLPVRMLKTRHPRKTEHATFSSDFFWTRRRHIPMIWKFLPNQAHTIFSACPKNSFNEIFELTIIYSVAPANGFKLITRGLSHYCWIRSNSVLHFADSTNGSSQKPERYEAKNVQNHIFRKFAELCHELT